MSFESIGHHFLSLDCQRKHSFYCHLRRISLIDINIKADFFFFFLLLVLKKCKPIVFLTSIFPLEWSTNIHIVASLSLSFTLAAFTILAVFIYDFQQFDLILLSPIVFIELLDIWLNIWNVLSHSLFNYFCSILLLWSPSWMPVTHMMHWNFSRNWILCSPPPPLPSFSLFISHWIFSLELPLFPYPLLCAVCS